MLLRPDSIPTHQKALDLYSLGVSMSTFIHEAGHTLSLNDLYMDEACELTMYGYTSIGETKKQSLGLGE